MIRENNTDSTSGSPLSSPPSTPTAASVVGGLVHTSPPSHLTNTPGMVGIANTPTTPNNGTDSNNNTPNSTSKKRPRGNYNCGKCGQKKRGHHCVAPGQQDGGGAEKVLKVDESISQNDYSMIPLGTVNDQHKSETEHLNRMISELTHKNTLLTQECEDLRNKLFALTGQMPVSSSMVAGSDYFKTDFVSPSSIVGGDVVVDENMESMESGNVNVDNTASTHSGDLNELSSAVQQQIESTRVKNVPRK